MGGVGKTQTVLHWVASHRDRYDHRVWVDMEQAPAAVFDEIADALGLELPAALHLVTNLIASQDTHWLFVFDNANRVADVKDFLPDSPNCHVIFTSRASRGWQQVGSVVVPTDVLDPDDAVALLCETAGLDAGSEAAPVAELLARLPLALVLGGSWIRATHTSFADYLQRSKGFPRITATDQAGYNQGIDALWKDSLAGAEARSPGAGTVFAVCAIADYQRVERPWLDTTAADLIGCAVEDVVERLAALEDYGLTQFDESSVAVVHNLVADGFCQQ